MDIVRDEFDGILITIDEGDTAGFALGSLLKRTIDGLAAGSDDRVCFAVAGLPELANQMKAGHASSFASFRTFSLGPLESAERAEVVSKGLAVAKDEYGLDVQVDDDALRLIAALSDGYPHFIQQFAYSAFDVDTDMRLTVDDVAKGAMGDGGALSELGNSIFHSQYFREVRSENSRAVLKALAEAELQGRGRWVSKAKLRDDTGISDSKLTNALKSLSDKHIILKDDTRRGYYRLPSWGFAMWIRQTLAASN